MKIQRVFPVVLLVAVVTVLAVQSSVGSGRPHSRRLAAVSSASPKGHLVIQGLGDDASAPKIMIRSYEWEAQQVRASGGGGAGTGTAELGDLTIEKLADGNSVALAEALVSGKHFSEAKVTIFKPGTTTPSSIFTLNEVLISSIHQSFETVNVESVSLNYAKIAWVFKSRAADHSFCWDVRANQSC